MWLSPTSVTVQTQDIKEIIARFDPYVQACRAQILLQLTKAPFSSKLIVFFERGKMLRPLLVFIAASAVGGNPATVVKAAEAVELLHGASLVHDDIIDEAVERRGLPALQTQVGDQNALMLGDYLLLAAFAALGEVENIYHPHGILKVFNVLSRCAMQSCHGQIEELAVDGQLDPEEAYLRIVRQKTASQFVAAATVGAILAGGTRSQIEALRIYGLNLGIAFQINDDLLDLAGDPQVLGKPVGNSLARGRLLLPLVYLHKYGSESLRRAYADMQERGYDRLELVNLLEQDHILARVKATQAYYIAAAVKALTALRFSEDIEALELFAHYVAAAAR